MSKVGYLSQAQLDDVLLSPIARVGQMKQHMKKDIENYKEGLILYLIRSVSESKTINTLKQFNVPQLDTKSNSPKGRIYNYITFSEVPKNITDMYISIDTVSAKTSTENNGLYSTMYIDIIYHPKFDLFLLKDKNKVYARTDIIFNAVNEIVKNNKETNNSKDYNFRTSSVTNVEMYKEMYNGTTEIDGFMLQRIMFDFTVL